MMLNKHNFTTNKQKVFNIVLTLENSIYSGKLPRLRFPAFSNITTTPPLPWHHGIVKCPSYAHFRISPEVVGHPGTSRLLFFEFYEFGHTTLLAYCFSHTI